jgi:hypothetical protein
VATAYFDNIQILKAIDERQRLAEGRPLITSAYQLLADVAGTYAPEPRQMPGFLQELIIARDAGQITWRLANQAANPQDANYYLQQIQDLALTPAGQDRARNRAVVLPPPDPDEDDGHDLSDLVLRQVDDAVAREYAPDQVATFLEEQSLPPDWLVLHDGTDPGDAHAILASVWRAGSMGRRLVRRFIGRWLDGRLITRADSEQRAALVDQLARRGLGQQAGLEHPPG